MRRRAILAATGIGVSTVLGGCLGGPDVITGDTTETPALNISDTGRVEGFPMYEDGFETETIGSREDVTEPDDNLPHDLRIWNPTENLREIAIEVLKLTNGQETVVLDDGYEVPADELLIVRLLEPADYRAVIDGPEIDGAESIDVHRDRFDCNDSHHEITVTPTGQVVHVVYSTAVQCEPHSPTPTPG